MSIKPALTAEEWAAIIPGDCRIYGYDDGGVYAANVDYRGEVECTGNPHGLAALALYGQPFGFTREDVRSLRWVAADGEPDQSDLNNLADRIEALLPPESAV